MPLSMLSYTEMTQNQAMKRIVQAKKLFDFSGLLVTNFTLELRITLSILIHITLSISMTSPKDWQVHCAYCRVFLMPFGMLSYSELSLGGLNSVRTKKSLFKRLLVYGDIQFPFTLKFKMSGTWALGKCPNNRCNNNNNLNNNNNNLINGVCSNESVFEVLGDGITVKLNPHEICIQTKNGNAVLGPQNSAEPLILLFSFVFYYFVFCYFVFCGHVFFFAVLCSFVLISTGRYWLLFVEVYDCNSSIDSAFDDLVIC